MIINITQINETKYFKYSCKIKFEMKQLKNVLSHTLYLFNYLRNSTTLDQLNYQSIKAINFGNYTKPQRKLQSHFKRARNL